ncbi:MAG TPA: ATP-binding protein [Steroidobacteraceae bacterium]
MSSVRARLLFWLLGGVVLLGAAGGWMVYRNALTEADAFFDYHLRQTALLLRDQPVEYQFDPDIPQTDAEYDFVVQVWTLDGLRVYLSRPHAVLPVITTLGFSTATTSEGRWRVFGVQALTKVIQVAQPMRVRERQAVQMALRALTPFALLMPVLVLLIWFAVGHALEPLKHLTGLLKAREVAALDPLPDSALPLEVQPLVGALNDLLGRLGAALERERGFIADAAHELRTPLTALHLQMGALARARSEVERAAAMEQLAAGVQRAIRLVEQLLSLSRQGPRPQSVRQPVRLDELAREIVAEMVPVADARSIDLGITASATAVILCDPDAVRTLLRNILDNALRYTPRDGRVDVSVERTVHGAEPDVTLRVLDTGPGIPSTERARVFDRFYRLPGTSPPGSGLGLAIVRAIADAHGARVVLDSGPRGAGLSVRVVFPGAPQASLAQATGAQAIESTSVTP